MACADPTFFKSLTKACIAFRLARESGSRKIDDGWTVAVTSGASSDGTNRPRSIETLNELPSSAFAAVAPRHTIIRGRTTAISASSHGRHALISPAFGLREFVVCLLAPT